MKKLFTILALSLFVASSAFAFKDDGNVHLTTGSGATISDPIRVYQLVRYPGDNANDPGLSLGDVVLWDAISKDGVTINVAGFGTSVDAVAGVIVSPTIPSADQALGLTSDVGHRNWGYMQTYGLCQAMNISSGPAAGGALVAGISHYATSVATSANNQQRTFAFAYDGSATGAGKNAFITAN